LPVKIKTNHPVYTGCPILTVTPKYLKMYKRYEKKFQTKVVRFTKRHKRVHWFDHSWRRQDQVKVTLNFLNETP